MFDLTRLVLDLEISLKSFRAGFVELENLTTKSEKKTPR